jgi:hypothetical protein
MSFKVCPRAATCEHTDGQYEALTDAPEHARGRVHPLPDRLRRLDPQQLRARPIAAHSDSRWAWISATIRIARCLSSGGYRLGVLPGHGPNHPTGRVSGHVGARFTADGRW